MTWIVPIIAAILIGISQWKINIIEGKISERKKQESAESQKIFENRVIENLNSNLQDKADKKLPGFGISTILTIHSLNEKRRKFIFDFGKMEEKDRVSLYLDTDNNFVYRIIDREAESHIIKVPQKIHTFRAESVYYLLLEYGYS